MKHRHQWVIDELKIRGMTQAELANKTGWNLRTINVSLMNGIKSVDLLISIADVLNWTTDEVLGREKANEAE